MTRSSPDPRWSSRQGGYHGDDGDQGDEHVQQVGVQPSDWRRFATVTMPTKNLSAGRSQVTPGAEAQNWPSADSPQVRSTLSNTSV